MVTERAMKMAIQKAKANGVAAITVFYQSHIGRLGDYPTMAAWEGMIGLITADSGKGPKAVAPFGGSARRLGTNPISIGDHCFIASHSVVSGSVVIEPYCFLGANCTLADGIRLARRTEQQRRRDGIFVEDETWQQLWTLAQKHNLEGVVGRP